MHLYNFHLKHLKTLRHISIFSDQHQGISSFFAKVITYSRFKIPTQHEMLPQHLVYKNELNREYVITLAKNDEIP